LPVNDGREALVSVILPTYKEGKNLEEAVDEDLPVP
jgi:glycosyltransferase involved in cell wall biosynthesis